MPQLGREQRSDLGGLEDFLVADGSGMVRFRSAVVRECAYEELPYRRGESSTEGLARR